MFDYSDPTGTGLLERTAALVPYRIAIHGLYREFARLPSSAFTLLEAFAELGSAPPALPTTVTWIAFPRTASASFGQIDTRRFDHQDEYVEWRVERSPNGAVTRVTFTTEFPEYYQALAEVSTAALVAGIQEVMPGASPSMADLFGPGFNPEAASPTARAERLRERALHNPWNNGMEGILFLTQQFNTASALFNLVGRCAVVHQGIAASAVCSAVGGACGPDRNSDPRVCEAAQQLARSGNGLTLQDPVGIQILSLQGIWKLNGQQLDINDPAQNDGAWGISRNGRRAMLDVTKGVTIGDDPVTTGAQVATKLEVGAVVLSTADAHLPSWARTGQESSRMIA